MWKTLVNNPFRVGRLERKCISGYVLVDSKLSHMLESPSGCLQIDGPLVFEVRDL